MTTGEPIEPARIIKTGVHPRWGRYTQYAPTRETVETTEQPDGTYWTTITAEYGWIGDCPPSVEK